MAIECGRRNRGRGFVGFCGWLGIGGVGAPRFKLVTYIWVGMVGLRPIFFFNFFFFLFGRGCGGMGFYDTGVVEYLFAAVFAGCGQCVRELVASEGRQVVNWSNGVNSLLEETWRGCLLSVGCVPPDLSVSCRSRQSQWAEVAEVMVSTGVLECGPRVRKAYGLLTFYTGDFMEEYGYECVAGVWWYAGLSVDAV